MKYVEKKMVSCQNCLKCASGAYPHGPYAYEVTGTRTKDRDSRKWRYLGKAGGGGGNADRIAGTLEVQPVEGQDAYANMSADEMKEVTKRTLLGARASSPPGVGSVRGSFVDACADAEHVAFYDEGNRANTAAVSYIGKAIYHDYIDAADRMLDEHGVRRADELPWGRQEELHALASKLYTDERRSIIAMQERSERQYEHLRGVLREAGIGDAPEAIVRGKSELRKLQRYQNANLAKALAGKTESEASAIAERIKGEYRPRKQEVRDRIREQRAKLHEVLEAAREDRGDGEAPPRAKGEEDGRAGGTGEALLEPRRNRQRGVRAGTRAERPGYGALGDGDAAVPERAAGRGTWRL